MFVEKTVSEMTFLVLALTFQGQGSTQTVSSPQHPITAAEAMRFLVNFAFSVAGMDPDRVQICLHACLKSRCKECGGGRIRPRGRLKSQCKECGGTRICPHGHRKSTCKACPVDKDDTIPDIQEFSHEEWEAAKFM
jgi:hypothetical protein